MPVVDRAGDFLSMMMGAGGEIKFATRRIRRVIKEIENIHSHHCIHGDKLDEQWKEANSAYHSTVEVCNC